MKPFKELAEEVGVHRVSIGRIIKRENIKSYEEYDPKIRKIIKVISDSDAKYILNKYKPTS